MSLQNYCESESIVGLSLKGGRRDQFFFCLLDHFEGEKRWFLKSLLQVKDEEGLTGDEAIRSWITQYNIGQMVLDFPLSQATCATCLSDCPGSNLCPEPSIVEVRKQIENLLLRDRDFHRKNPKRYEQDRNSDDNYDHGRNITYRRTTDYLMSRSFKRRLKKGFIPYWNRPLDFLIWKSYYDQLLEFFNLSFDSFGSTSLMVQSRFSYLRRHFPKELELYESYGPLILIELLRSNLIKKKDLHDLRNIELGLEARLSLIKGIEKAFHIFIYDHDLELLVQNPRAFDSFLLALAGQNKIKHQERKLPPWVRPQEVRFIIPQFPLSLS